MIAKKCCGWWPSSHLGATCSKIHCWRCLKHRYRASQCELSNVSRGSKFEKSDRHRNWIEVETVFYHMDGGTAASCGFDAVNNPSVLSPTTRRWAEAHGKPWAVKPKPKIWKPKSRDSHSTVPSLVDPMAFRFMAGRNHGFATAS